MAAKPLILACDDELGVRESLKLILSKDYTLEFLENGLELLDRLDKTRPDLVLLDIKMPKIHGLEILKQIKAAHPEIPVILVTGYQSVEIAQEAVRAGAADYLTKPFDSGKILKAVERILLKR